VSQPDQSSAQPGSHVMFNGPTFHVSGLQVVSDPEEVSLYLTASRHAFNATASQVRTVNEIVARLIMSPAAATRFADILKTYAEQQAARTTKQA